jgi:hypothetical protein
MDKPKIENAPGLVWRPRKDEWMATWQARSDLVKRGYLPKVVNIWTGAEPSEIDKQLIADRCMQLQNEMLVWGRGGVPIVGAFDGTLQGLVKCYQTDADSTYRKLRYKSRVFYDTLCGILLRDHAGEKVDDIKARTILRWYEGWSADGKVAMGHAMVGMLRTLCSFGSTILEDDGCARVKGLMSDMRFTMAKPRGERLTAEQVVAIRQAAHAACRPSIALAQAIQFECMLRQKDVIGEWVPKDEPGLSDIVNEAGEKWLRGLRWHEIDRELILRHTTSKRNKDIEVNLRMAPMVMEELARIGDLPSSGPVIRSEITGRPYKTLHFRTEWRTIATAAGVPTAVKNMDTRAGAISEATDAGAELEHVRHAATHGDISMTQRYSRGGTEKIAQVQKARIEYRNKK